MEASTSVSSGAQLMSALSTAQAGDTISLAGGNYGTLELNGLVQKFANYAGEVTITSADSKTPAVFTSIDLDHVANLTFDGVKFDATPASAGGFNPFCADNVDRLTIRNSVFDGQLEQGLGTKQGFFARSSSNVSFEHNEVFNFYFGAGFDEITNLREIGNDFHHLSFDATRHGQIVGGLIENNRYHDMTSTKEDHRDMIQFWTEGDKIPSQNIVIRGNIITIDDAPAKIQGIFWGNSAVKVHGAGSEMYYQNITIEDNIIYMNQPHGIFLQAVNGLDIRNNVVLNDSSNMASKSGWHPVINIDPVSTNVSINGNVGHAITQTTAAWNVTDNTIVKVGTVPAIPVWDGSDSDKPLAPKPVEPAPVEPGSESLLLTGTAGNDQLSGAGGRDALSGGDGSDGLYGGADADVLIGGRGADMFVFGLVGDSAPGGADAIRGEDGVSAFEEIGAAAGDLIDVSAIDANELVAGNQAFAFGEMSIGGLSAVDKSGSTYVRLNVDADPGYELVLWIDDGEAGAFQYTATDFIL